MYYILSPFSMLLNFFYSFTQSYGIAVILFAVVVKVVLFPFAVKGKKGMIQMNMLSGKMQQLQKQYGKDKERYNLEVQRLYEREKVNPMSGCLWSFLPILVLLPLYAIIREPLFYMMGLSTEQIATVAQTLDWQNVAVANGWVSADAMAKLVQQVADGQLTSVFQNGSYNQLFLASLLTPDQVGAVQAALGDSVNVFAMNFEFLGLDLAAVPNWQFWTNLSWQGVGLFLLPLISAGLGFLFSRISMRTNRMTNGPTNEAADRTSKMMIWMSPIISLYIGFIMPAALCIYWIANNLLSMLQEFIAGKMLKKDYEAARAAAQERERQEKEDEKRRKEEARLERQRRLEEEKKNRGKKKPQGKKEDAPAGINRDDSRVGIRAYARGRSYDPQRFGGVTPYNDPNDQIAAQAQKEQEQQDKKKKKKSDPDQTQETPELQAAPVSQEEPVPEDASAQEETPVEEASQDETQADSQDQDGEKKDGE